jgi:epoxyqueuosine reductase
MEAVRLMTSAPSGNATTSELGQSLLPGVDGTYDRVACSVELARNAGEAARTIEASEQKGEALAQNMDAYDQAVPAILKADGKHQHRVKYCRMCELSCPVGKGISRSGRPARERL